MVVIGLTGGMASGKSTVARHLFESGIPVFDADKVARDVVKPGTDGLAEVIKEFGREYLVNGELDRGKLAGLVFADIAKLSKLNAIVHGRVWALAKKFICDHKNNGDKVVVLDVPLLIESGWNTKVDKVWVVYIPREEQIRRAMKRNGMSQEMAEKRLNNQMNIDKLVQYADVVIDNDGPLVETLSFVDKEIARL